MSARAYCNPTCFLNHHGSKVWIKASLYLLEPACFRRLSVLSSMFWKVCIKIFYLNNLDINLQNMIFIASLAFFLISGGQNAYYQITQSFLVLL